MHAPLRAQQSIARNVGVEITEAEDGEHGVDEEDQLAARAQDAGRFRDPRVRVAPDARAVLGDREAKAVVSERRLLGVPVMQRERNAVLGLESTCGRELRLRVVDANRARTAPRQPGGDIARATPELDCVETSDRSRQHANLSLRITKEPPTGIFCPRTLPGGDIVRRPGIPLSPVARDVVGKLAH